MSHAVVHAALTPSADGLCLIKILTGAISPRPLCHRVRQDTPTRLEGGEFFFLPGAAMDDEGPGAIRIARSDNAGDRPHPITVTHAAKSYRSEVKIYVQTKDRTIQLRF